MHTYNNWKFENINDLVQNYSEAQSGCPVTYTYTFDEVDKLLSPYFKISNIHKDHIFKYDIDNYIRNNYIIDSTFHNMSDDYFTSLKKELGWHTMVISEKKV